MQLGLLLFETGDRFDLQAVLDYATLADEAGYSRFWLGEHYDGSKYKLWCNPEPLMPILAGITEQLSIGCAGIILRLHNPYRVALSFKLMNAFFPGRIDLGLAAGYSTELPMKYLTGLDETSIKTLSFDKMAEQIFSLYDHEVEHAEKGLFVAPYLHPAPRPWLLSLSAGRLSDSLRFRANYSRSIFHSFAQRDGFRDEMLRYKDEYYRQYHEIPKINLAFAGIMAESTQEATRIHASTIFSQPGSFYVANLLGDADRFGQTLLEWQEKYALDEFVFLDLAPNMEHRMETAKQLSEVLKLAQGHFS